MQRLLRRGPGRRRRRRPARQRQLGLPVGGRLGAVRQCASRPASSPSSSTWSPSWTPSPRSRPARWPSGGSGAASSSGACSAAPSTTRCSRRGRGAAAGWPRRGTRWASAPATSTSPAAASSTPSAARPRSAGALVLGPRIGKFGADGKPRALARPPHPDGDARHVHPAVRLVRLQRRLDVRRDRRAVRHRRHEHGDRRRLRRHRRHAVDHQADRQAGPRA